jgi:hypothetical protein
MGELQDASDRFIAYYGTLEAVQHATHVIDKFEWMFDLIMSRALEELAIPCEVIQLFKPQGMPNETNLRHLSWQPSKE